MKCVVSISEFFKPFHLTLKSKFAIVLKPNIIGTNKSSPSPNSQLKNYERAEKNY